MNPEEIKFITEIIKPWEKLNLELGKPYLLNNDISDFTNQANLLAVSLKHILEATQGIEPKTLISQSRSYEIISDLADSSKHGKLKKNSRECKLYLASMHERRNDVKVRFLRNLITIHHNTYGKIDFMECSRDCGLFISKKLNIDWTPQILNNSGEFTNEIRLHASKNNQIAITAMQFQFVELNEKGEYVNVDLNGQVMIHLTFDNEFSNK